MTTAPSGGQKPKTGQTSTAAYHGQKGKKSQTSTPVYHEQKAKAAQTSNAAYQTQKAKKNQTQAERQAAKAANAGHVEAAGKPKQAKTEAVSGQNAGKGKFAQGKPIKPQHFNLPKQPNTAKAPPVKFQQGQTDRKEAKTGKASNTQCSATTNQSGTIRTGGTIITITTSRLCSERLITGTRATGSQPGVTLPTRIMHGMGLSTLIIACHQIK